MGISEKWVALFLTFLSGLTSVTPKLDSLVNEVIRSFSFKYFNLTKRCYNNEVSLSTDYRTHIHILFSASLPPAWVGPRVVLSRSSVFIGGISGALTA